MVAINIFFDKFDFLKYILKTAKNVNGELHLLEKPNLNPWIFS